LHTTTGLYNMVQGALGTGKSLILQRKTILMQNVRVVCPQRSIFHKYKHNFESI